jgi:serine/threonine protein kinase
VEKSDEALIEKIILRELDHPNIIKLLSSFQSADKLYFVLEYAPNRDLSWFIRNNVDTPFALVQFYVAEIVNVLEYMHIDKNIAHRDLKPANIMLDKNFHLKLVININVI